MQTFLPYKSYTQSAAVLDTRRLGKQRVEGLQIANALANPEYGWQHHPAVNMWRGHFGALAEYVLTMCCEWTVRGYKDTVGGKILALIAEHPDILEDLDPPPCVGDEAVHRSHRSNLLRKDPEWYGQWGWTEPSDLPYVWVIPDYAPAD